MPLEVRYTKAALKYLESRDRRTKAAIEQHIAKLALDPFSFPLSKPLRGRLERTCRVGDYRIIFSVEESESALFVAIIGHRKDVYDQ